MRGIRRTFGGHVALRDVAFSLRPGEVHALLGENGAGKTTLMRILAGLLPADSGDVTLDGAPFTARDRRRVAMVHQHFMLVPTMTVIDNVLLGRARGLVRRRDRRAVEAELTALAERTGLAVRPRARVEDLSVGEQQRVEILRALRQGARFLLLDEPTAHLAPTEVAALLAQMRALAREHGIAVAVITHHLDEVMEVADRVTVLRGGERVAELPVEKAGTAELARLMVGHEVELDRWRPASGAPGGVRLELARVTVRGPGGSPALDSVDLVVRAGETVAVAGVEGNGQSVLEDVASGLTRIDEGRFAVDGTDLGRAATPRRLRAARLGVVPADRYRRGLAASLGIDVNLVLDRFGEPPYRTRWGLSPAAVRRRATEVIRRMRIAAPAPATLVGQLSGGHAQRVVLGRVLDDDLAVLVASQPTRGLDVAATEFVWGELERLRARGVAILLISSDLDEVLSLADRCVVLYRGKVVSRFDQGPFDRAAVGAAMGGRIQDEGGDESGGAGGDAAADADGAEDAAEGPG